MRSTKPRQTTGNIALISALFIVVVLSAWPYFQRTKFTAGAAAAQLNDPPLARLSDSDGGKNDNFGVSVSISGDMAVVGSRLLTRAVLYVKQSGNTVAVQSASARSIKGTFVCACKSQTGICQLSITKEAALCAGNCSDCRLEVVVDPVKASPSKKVSN